MVGFRNEQYAAMRICRVEPCRLIDNLKIRIDIFLMLCGWLLLTSMSQRAMIILIPESEQEY